MGLKAVEGCSLSMHTPSPQSMAQVMTSVTSSCELGHRAHEQGQTSFYSWVSERLAVGTKTLFSAVFTGDFSNGLVEALPQRLR